MTVFFWQFLSVLVLKSSIIWNICIHFFFNTFWLRRSFQSFQCFVLSSGTGCDDMFEIWGFLCLFASMQNMQNKFLLGNINSLQDIVRKQRIFCTVTEILIPVAVKVCFEIDESISKNDCVQFIACKMKFLEWFIWDFPPSYLFDWLLILLMRLTQENKNVFNISKVSYRPQKIEKNWIIKFLFRK